MAIDQLVLLIIAFFANLFSSFSGGGAGLLQLPVLIFLGLPFTPALATHKVATVALGLGASIRHWKDRRLQWPMVIIMLTAGVPGVILGANLIVQIPGRWAEIALGILTVGLGLYSHFNPGLGQQELEKNRHLNGYMTGAIGLFFIGFLNGSLTSGTGLFATMWLVRWFGMDYLRAVAHTLVLVGLAWNGTGAITLGMLVDIHWPWMPALLIGSLAGGYAGAHLAINAGNKAIKRAFEILTVLIGVKLLIG